MTAVCYPVVDRDVNKFGFADTGPGDAQGRFELYFEQFGAILPLEYKRRTRNFRCKFSTGRERRLQNPGIPYRPQPVDDEIIAVNLATGSYLILNNTTSELWSLLERGPASADSLTAAFTEASACASQEISIFLQGLHDEGLRTTRHEMPVLLSCEEWRSPGNSRLRRPRVRFGCLQAWDRNG